tara:strand:- start:3382 stop:3990 length:609 start_codon:yes stop_codon:yes gene_type:complete
MADEEYYKSKIGALSELGENKSKDPSAEFKELLSKAETIDVNLNNNSLTPTRGVVSDFLVNKIYGDDATKENYQTVTNFIGGDGQGFYDMGSSDITFVPAFLDSYDAYNRLQKTRKTDDFSDSKESVITNSPFALKVAGILSGSLGYENIISDYYDGKKMDITTMYGGPLGILGIKAGVLNLLKKLGRSAANAPQIEKFLLK